MNRRTEQRNLPNLGEQQLFLPPPKCLQVSRTCLLKYFRPVSSGKTQTDAFEEISGIGIFALNIEHYLMRALLKPAIKYLISCYNVRQCVLFHP